MKIKTRQYAFIAHLVISLLILFVALSVIFFFWFPNGLIYAGGITGLKIIIGVDLILGPLLTLIVYNPNKKSLIFDLSCIAALQLGCLCYGLLQIYNQRPVLQITANDGVHLISASDAKFYDIDLQKIPGKNPKKVMMKLPSDKSSWGAIIFASEFTDNKPFALQQSLYLSLADITEQEYQQRIDILTAKTKKPDVANKNCAWVTVFSVHLGIDSVACINKQDGIIELSNM